MKCSWCGKEFTVLYPELWAYKVGGKWFCSWKCLRADEKKGKDEMPRMKKDGTPAKRPGPRKPKENLLKKDEYEKTIDDLETEVADMINDDVPMTAEERSEKWPMIPTRVETKNGTWEIVDGYKGFDTLVGFRSKSAHEFGPLGERAYAIVLTVSEWDAMHDEMDQAMNMMKL